MLFFLIPSFHQILNELVIKLSIFNFELHWTIYYIVLECHLFSSIFLPSDSYSSKTNHCQRLFKRCTNIVNKLTIFIYFPILVSSAVLIISKLLPHLFNFKWWTIFRFESTSFTLTFTFLVFTQLRITIRRVCYSHGEEMKNEAFRKTSSKGIICSVGLRKSGAYC